MKRCLVLGGSGAVGGAVCRALAAGGARVAFTYHTGKQAAAELAEALPGAIALPADAAQVVQLERAVDEAASAFSGLDALVHCIGIGVEMECSDGASRHRMPEVSEADWDRMLQINTKSAYFAVRRAIGPLRDAGGGNVVLVGSVDAVKPVPSPVHYAASKGALGIMAQAMAKELGESGILVNMVAPGALEAGLSRLLPENLIQEYKKHCGFKRLGRLAEVADLVAWLAQHNTYMTGQTLAVDGGL